MKTKAIIVPDKILELKHGDEVRVYTSKNKITFSIFCDGTGFDFSLTKDELKEMLK